MLTIGFVVVERLEVSTVELLDIFIKGALTFTHEVKQKGERNEMARLRDSKNGILAQLLRANRSWCNNVGVILQHCSDLESFYRKP